MKPWKCPNCRRRAGVPVLYGLPTAEAAAAAQRGELVLGGCVLTDDDPPRYCTACRAALWPRGVFAVPAGAAEMRIVLLRRSSGQRLESVVGDGGALSLEWAGAGVPEAATSISVEVFDLLLVVLAMEVLGDGAGMGRWLERRALVHVGDVSGPVKRFSFTGDGMLAVSGRRGDLLLHGSLPRLLLHLVDGLFTRHGLRTISEFREWLEATGLDLGRLAA